MGEKVKVASASEIQPGGRLVVEAGGKQIAIFNVNGKLVACDNVCLHRGGPLGEGDIEELIVTCPWHGWQFDVTTGVNPQMPAAKLETYPVQLADGQVQIGIE